MYRVSKILETGIWCPTVGNNMSAWTNMMEKNIFYWINHAWLHVSLYKGVKSRSISIGTITEKYLFWMKSVIYQSQSSVQVMMVFELWIVSLTQDDNKYNYNSESRLIMKWMTVVSMKILNKLLMMNDETKSGLGLTVCKISFIYLWSDQSRQESTLERVVCQRYVF